MSEICAAVLPGLRKITPPPVTGSGWQSPNIYLLGDDPLTMVDAGYARPEQVALIRAEIKGARLERILLTHGHVDHAGGAWELRERFGAEVWAHPAEAAAISRRFPGKKADRDLRPGEKIPAGDFLLEPLLFPGHARGHLVFYVADRGLLFSGDLVTGEGSSLVAPPEGNMKDYMDSLHALRKMPLSLLLPGHGPVVRDPARRVAELIEHRELRELCIARCLADKPLPLGELVRAMYLGLIHPQLEGAAVGTAWAHLEKMIAEGNVIAEPENETNPFKMTFRLRPGVSLPG